jgi:hypothetical protein
MACQIEGRIESEDVLEQGAEENICSSLMICIPHYLLLGWCLEGGWDGWGRWHIWERKKLVELWWENMKEVGYLEDWGIDRS